MAAPFAIAVLISVLGTSFLSGIFGMAGGLVLMGIFAALLPVQTAMILHAISQMTANGFRAANLLRHVRWKTTAPFVLGSLAATVAMWRVSFVPSRPLVFLLLGLMPFVSLIKKAPRLSIDRSPDAALAGALVTLVQLTAGVSGPLLDLFYLDTKMNRFEIIANKAATQTLGHFLKFLYFGAAVTKLDLPVWLMACVIAFAMAGTLVGGMVLKKMTDADFRSYSRKIVLALGSFYLCKGIWEFVV